MQSQRILSALVTIAMSLISSSVFAGNGKGNGGSFTEQDIYLAIHEIGTNLKELDQIDFGLNGKQVLAELHEKQFLVLVTPKPVFNRNGQLSDAINFAPGEIKSSEISYFNIPVEPSLNRKRIIIANKRSWDSKLDSGKSIKNLVAHELWGAMGEKDIAYQKTTPFVLKMREIENNPLAYSCRFNETIKMRAEDIIADTSALWQTFNITGFGNSRKNALESLLTQVYNSKLSLGENSIKDIQKSCKIDSSINQP